MAREEGHRGAPWGLQGVPHTYPAEPPLSAFTGSLLTQITQQFATNLQKNEVLLAER